MTAAIIPFPAGARRAAAHVERCALKAGAKPGVARLLGDLAADDVRSGKQSAGWILRQHGRAPRDDGPAAA